MAEENIPAGAMRLEGPPGAGEAPDDDLRILRDRWTQFVEIMKTNMVHLNDSTDRLPIQTLHREFKESRSMPFEFKFVDPDSLQRREMEITDAFWNCLLFRPDMAQRVADLLADDDVGGRGPAAALVQRAIDWPRDFWRPRSSLANSSPAVWKRAVLRAADALPGLATTALLELQHCGLVDNVAGRRIAAEAAFSRSRGLELALCLRLANRCQVLRAIEENAFVTRVLGAAALGLWNSPRPSLCSLPDLPEYFCERRFFAGLKQTLGEAVSGSAQHWLALSGQSGAGKTICAAFLAREAPVSLVLWIPFGRRPDEAVFESAQRIIRRSFPSSDPDGFSTAKDFLSATLTADATDDVIICVDDVWKADQLAPFARAKTVLLTSRSRISYRRVSRTDVFEVPLSMEESEGELVAEKILGCPLSA